MTNAIRRVNITDKPSRVLKDRKGDNFVERVEPRCFTRALNSGSNVKFLLNHNHNINLGSLDEGNLKLTEDNIGLKIDATVNHEEKHMKMVDLVVLAMVFKL